MSNQEQDRFNAIAEMRQRGLSVIEAIKETRLRFRIGLAEAKGLVEMHPAWFPPKPPAAGPVSPDA